MVERRRKSKPQTARAKPTTVGLSAQIVADLRDVADARLTSVSQLARQFISEGLQRYHKEAARDGR